MELAAKRRGITKSQFIVEAVSAALGHRDAQRLLLEVREKYPQPARPSSSGARSARTGLAAALREQHERESAEWQAWAAGKGVGKRRTA
jgi:RHH-type rel operon transcriptional repressor/antitoxin RelB